MRQTKLNIRDVFSFIKISPHFLRTMTILFQRFSQKGILDIISLKVLLNPGANLWTRWRSQAHTFSKLEAKLNVTTVSHILWPWNVSSFKISQKLN